MSNISFERAFEITDRELQLKIAEAVMLRAQIEELRADRDVLRGQLCAARDRADDYRAALDKTKAELRRLHAMLPHLLDALREAERCALSLCDANKFPRDTCPADLLDMARAAIANATRVAP